MVQGRKVTTRIISGKGKGKVTTRYVSGRVNTSSSSKSSGGSSKKFTVTKVQKIGSNKSSYLGSGGRLYSSEAEARSSYGSSGRSGRSSSSSKKSTASPTASIDFTNLGEGTRTQSQVNLRTGKTEGKSIFSKVKKKTGAEIRAEKNQRDFLLKLARESQMQADRRRKALGDVKQLELKTKKAPENVFIIDKIVGARLKKKKYSIAKDFIGTIAEETPRQLEQKIKTSVLKVGGFAKSFTKNRVNQIKKNLNLSDDLAKQMLTNPRPVVLKLGNAVNDLSRPRNIPLGKVLPLVGAFIQGQTESFARNPAKYLAGAGAEITLQVAFGKAIDEVIGVLNKSNVVSKAVSNQSNKIDDVLSKAKKGGLSNKKLQKIKAKQNEIKRALVEIEGVSKDIKKTKVTKGYSKKILKKSKVLEKKNNALINKLKKNQSELIKDLEDQFKRIDLEKSRKDKLKSKKASKKSEKTTKKVKSTSEPIKVKLSNNEAKKFIDRNIKNTGKLENFLESSFGTKNFKKYKKLIEAKTGKKVLVRQTKRKILKVKGGKVKEKTFTKVNIVEKKGIKTQKKKPKPSKTIDLEKKQIIKEKKTKVKKLKVEPIINIKEVKKASAEIELVINDGGIDRIARTFNKWDKKGQFKGLSTTKRKGFVKNTTRRVQREYNDLKQVYRNTKQEFNKVAKQYKELSAKKKAKGSKAFTQKESRQLAKSSARLEKTTKTLKKLDSNLVKLGLSSRVLSKALVIALNSANASNTEIMTARGIETLGAQAQGISQDTGQDLKKALKLSQLLKQLLKTPIIKPPKPPKSPKKKNGGSPQRPPSKPITPPKPPKPPRGKVGSPSKPKPPKKPPKVPKLKLRLPKQKKKKKYNKKGAIVYTPTGKKKAVTIKTGLPINKAKKVALKGLDNSILGSVSVKAYGKTLEKDIKDSLSRKNRRKKSKSQRVQEIVEKRKHRLDTPGEKKGISFSKAIKSELKKAKKKTVKKAVRPKKKAVKKTKPKMSMKKTTKVKKVPKTALKKSIKNIVKKAIKKKVIKKKSKKKITTNKKKALKKILKKVVKKKSKKKISKKKK